MKRKSRLQGEIRKEVKQVKAEIHRVEKAYLDKIQGSLIGGAIGDALGYPVEFLSERMIREQYGKDGICAYSLDADSGKALISDDTQMTLFTATGLLFGETRMRMRGIAASPEDYVWMSYLNWLQTQDAAVKAPFRCSWLMNIRALYARRAPGYTCLSALRESLETDQHGTTAHRINQSKGCGGIMRVAPVGLFFHHSIEQIDRIGAGVAAITHGHPLGYLPAAVLTHILNKLVYEGGDLAEIVSEALTVVVELYGDDPKYVPDLGTLDDLIRKAIKLAKNGRTDFENIKELGEGWVAEETLAIAIYCSLRYRDDFSAGIVAAVNHDGDSDSAGAVTGQILGARLGYRAIPEKWKTDLELSDVILEIAKDLCDHCRMGEYDKYGDPVWDAKYIGITYPQDALLPYL